MIKRVMSTSDNKYYVELRGGEERLSKGRPRIKPSDRKGRENALEETERQ